MTFRKITLKYLRTFKLFRNNLLDFLLTVTLVIMFFCILQPLGLILKLVGYDPLRKRISRKIKKSYRENIKKNNINFNKKF